MAYLESLLSTWYNTLLQIAPLLAVLLIVLGGVIYGLSYLQPAETRGKWQSRGVEIALGGVVVAAIAGAATVIQEIASKLLT